MDPSPIQDPISFSDESDRRREIDETTTASSSICENELANDHVVRIDRFHVDDDFSDLWLSSDSNFVEVLVSRLASKKDAENSTPMSFSVFDRSVVDFNGIFPYKFTYVDGRGNRLCGENDSFFGLDLIRIDVRDVDYLVVHKNFCRSGSLFYRPLPTNIEPLHQVRVRAKDFRRTRKQRRVMNRFERYLKGEWNPPNKNEKESNSDAFDSSVHEKEVETNGFDDELHQLCECCSHVFRDGVSNVLRAHANSSPPELDIISSIQACEDSANAPIHWHPIKQRGRRYDLSTCFVRSFLRSCWSSSSMSTTEGRNKLAVYMRSIMECLSHQLPMRSDRSFKCHPDGRCTLTIFLHDQPRKDSSIPSCRTDSSSLQSVPSGSLSPHVFEFSLVPAEFSEERFLLYQKYQEHVHAQECSSTTPLSFRHHHCQSCLFAPEHVSLLSPLTNFGVSFGSIFSEYRIDGKLFGLGMLDSTPMGLNSLYFAFDPDYSFLSPGVLSAVYEIELVASLAEKLDTFEYYFLGVYAPGCVKTSYKMDYQPLEICCCHTFRWMDTLDENVRYRVENPSEFHGKLYDSFPASDHFSNESFESWKYRQEIAVNHCFHKLATLPQESIDFSEMYPYFASYFVPDFDDHVGVQFFQNLSISLDDRILVRLHELDASVEQYPSYYQHLSKYIEALGLEGVMRMTLLLRCREQTR